MNSKQIDELRHATLEDDRLSRGERSELRAAMDDFEAHEFALLRNRVFEITREQMGPRNPEVVLAWCEAVIKLAGAREAGQLAAVRTVRQEAFFSPGDSCVRRIIESIDRARERIDVCVFTVTDDRLTAALAAAHRQRSVAVRVITDDEKSRDMGSDIGDLARLGIEIRMDRTDDHMHHKFAIFDARTVLTGSYNWTRSAARHNQENFVISDDPVLIREFGQEFDRLWEAFAR